ncbi:MAG TPA: NAD-binding protein [Thermoleophilaceae bacterium]|nr:NAD-binding protein [Thermoleophilaceae bacterium]
MTDASPHDRSAPDGSAGRHILLIGYDELTEVTDRALTAAGARVTHLRNPNDRAVRKALTSEIDSVLVLSQNDHVSLRLALIIENARPGVPLVVTVFGRIVASQLQRAVPSARVMSMADIVVPSLAGPCFDSRLLSVSRRPEGLMGVLMRDEGPGLVPIEPYRASPLQRLVANIGALISPFELSARILLAGLLGFLLILVLEIVVLALALDESFVAAFYSATKTIVTVGPNPLVDDAPSWLKVFSAVAMLAALGFTAIFTAGVVDRLLSRRLTAILGRRSVPRRDHVVVVGLGQVGLRLCLLLRDLGVPVLAVESNPENYHVDRAKDYGIPVVIGRGGSRFLLRRLCLGRARALAAVTSDEVENISIVVAALGMRSDIRTILRAGRGEVVNETRSLFTIGVVRDVYRIGGTLMAAAALGSEAEEAFLHDKTVYLIQPDGRIDPFEADLEAARDAELEYESEPATFEGATRE